MKQYEGDTLENLLAASENYSSTSEVWEIRRIVRAIRALEGVADTSWYEGDTGTLIPWKLEIEGGWNGSGCEVEYSATAKFTLPTEGHLSGLRFDSEKRKAVKTGKKTWTITVHGI